MVTPQDGSAAAAFTVEEDAVVNDGKIFVYDGDVYQDEITGNYLNPSDDPLDPYPEVLTEILKDAAGDIFVRDETAQVVDVDGTAVVFTIDEFAHIETAADGTQTVWTPNGEQELVGSPVYTTDSLAAAGFGEEKNPQTGEDAGQSVVITGQTVFNDEGQELIIFDPTQQSISTTLVDGDTLTSRQFDSLLTTGSQ